MHVPNWHPTEDELVLHYYGEAPAEIRQETEAHLAACAPCAAAWRELTGVLGAVAAVPVPEPDEGFERVMWARISRDLPVRRRSWFSGQIAVFGSLAAALVAVVAGTMTWIAFATRDAARDTPSVAEAPGPSDSRERVLLTALTEHLSRTEILLVEVMNAQPVASADASPDEDAWTFQRTTADDLVASGRLYRATARQTGELQVANMLDDLEGVLVEVATTPEAVDRRNVDFLRARIEDDALLFKVRAVASDIRGRQTRLMYSE
jgi:anti-sigma factor RsiW